MAVKLVKQPFYIMQKVAPRLPSGRSLALMGQDGCTEAVRFEALNGPEEVLPVGGLCHVAVRAVLVAFLDIFIGVGGREDHDGNGFKIGVIFNNF